MKLILTVVVTLLLSALGMYGYLSSQQAPVSAEEGASVGEAGGANTAAVAVDPLQSALDLAAERGCTACHSTDGSKSIGPSWMGSYGTFRAFADGSGLKVDDNYLRESMLQPAARIAAGYQNVMVPPQLSESDITVFVGLIRDLTARMPQ
jgi:cytochrome c oxidase subunit II